jgi:hypothetical protein
MRSAMNFNQGIAVALDQELQKGAGDNRGIEVAQETPLTPWDQGGGIVARTLNLADLTNPVGLGVRGYEVRLLALGAADGAQLLVNGVPMTPGSRARYYFEDLIVQRAPGSSIFGSITLVILAAEAAVYQEPDVLPAGMDLLFFKNDWVLADFSNGTYFVNRNPGSTYGGDVITTGATLGPLSNLWDVRRYTEVQLWVVNWPGFGASGSIQWGLLGYPLYSSAVQALTAAQEPFDQSYVTLGTAAANANVVTKGRWLGTPAGSQGIGVYNANMPAAVRLYYSTSGAPASLTSSPMVALIGRRS